MLFSREPCSGYTFDVNPYSLEISPSHVSRYFEFLAKDNEEVPVVGTKRGHLHNF